MKSASAIVVAPRCVDSRSNLYFPGFLNKLSQVIDLLSTAGFRTVVANTSPVQNLRLSPNDHYLAFYQNRFLRLFELLFSRYNNLCEVQPSLLWVYNSRFPEAIVVWRLLRRFSNIFLVVELEDLPGARLSHGGLVSRLDWLSTRWLLSKARLVTCVSPVAAVALQRHIGIDEERLVVLPGLLSDSFIQTVDDRKRLPFSRRRIRIVYAGGYTPDKGVEDLLFVFLRLPVNQYRLHLIGPAPRALRSRFKYKTNVFFHGTVSDELLHESYASADIVVNPHRSILNGDYVFPFKSIEQAASGALPLMSTQLGADQLGLPSSCLFTNNDQLYTALIHSHEIWLKNKFQLQQLALQLRHTHSLAAIAELMATRLGNYGYI
jgi:glycosyltransferase involved in cell wall biosynthesis